MMAYLIVHIICASAFALLAVINYRDIPELVEEIIVDLDISQTNAAIVTWFFLLLTAIVIPVVFWCWVLWEEISDRINRW